MSNTIILTDYKTDLGHTTEDVEAIDFTGTTNSQLRSLAGIEKASKMILFRLSTFPLLVIDKEIKHTFEQLVELVITNCKKVEHMDLGMLPKLVRLDVDNNAIQCLNVSSAPELTYLDASNNALSLVNLLGNPKLEVLKLNNNKIDKIDLSNQKVLKSLNLSDNTLSYVPRLPDPHTLQFLALSFNKFQQRQNVVNLGYLCGLQHFQFVGNCLSKCPFTRCFIASLLPDGVKEVNFESLQQNSIADIHKLWKRKSVVEARNARLKQLELNADDLLKLQSFQDIIKEKQNSKMTPEAQQAIEILQFAITGMENDIIALNAQIKSLEALKEGNVALSKQRNDVRSSGESEKKQFQLKEEQNAKEKLQLQKQIEDAKLIFEEKYQNLQSQYQSANAIFQEMQVQLTNKTQEATQLQQQVQQHSIKLVEATNDKNNTQKQLSQLIQFNSHLKQEEDSKKQQSDFISQQFEQRLRQQNEDFQMQMQNLLMQQNQLSIFHQNEVEQQRLTFQTKIGKQYEQMNEQIEKMTRDHNEQLTRALQQIKQYMAEESNALKDQNESLQQYLQANILQFQKEISDLQKEHETEMSKERVKRSQDLDSLNKNIGMMAKAMVELQKKKKDETVVNLMGAWNEVQAGWKQMQ